ncbi:sugar phosphate isomerase/epimerase family protein [Demequina phytophila]|uniref:sugar phosphate isomerase/epimerase family protein n=1 Tax=Demequina phytophila TaxID=1638981 RepID=UPI00078463C5|nr:sugar phosphate isomerase/epimerase [Demequina phytophila]
MKAKFSTRNKALAAAAAAAVAGGIALAAPATAAPPSPHANDAAQCSGRSVPASKISIQLFSYLGWQFQLGDIEPILAELQEVGIKNVEPFGTPGSTFSSYGNRTAAEFRELLKEYGIKAPSSHGSTTEATFPTTLELAKDLGQKWVGSGGFAAPGITSYENVLATAETMNRLGEASVKNGTGKFFGHNHNQEFETMYADPETGEMKSAWQILAENTDPRYVAFEVDVYWAVTAGVDVPALLDEYGDRIDLLHIKDGNAPYGRSNITDVGEGDIDWAPILEAAQGKVRYYVLERDGAPNDIEFAKDSFEYLSCLSF